MNLETVFGIVTLLAVIALYAGYILMELSIRKEKERVKQEFDNLKKKIEGIDQKRQVE